MPASKESPQSKGGKARSEKLSPERRSQIAKAAATTRWKQDREPSSTLSIVVTDADREKLEALRAAHRQPSAAATIRKLIREAHKKL